MVFGSVLGLVLRFLDLMFHVFFPRITIEI